MTDPNLPTQGMPKQHAPQAPVAPALPVGLPPMYPSLGVPQPTQSKGLALSSLIVGIFSFLIGLIPFLGFVSGAVAVILGIVALVKRQPAGMAVAGLVTGGIAAITGLFVFVFIVATIPVS